MEGAWSSLSEKLALLAVDDAQRLAQQALGQRLALVHGALEARGQQQRPVQHRVAQVDRAGLAIAHPHRLLAAAQPVAVLQVVVDQGGVVQHLTGRPKRHHLAWVDLEGLGDRQRQQRAQPLAAGVHVVAVHRRQRRALWRLAGGHRIHQLAQFGQVLGSQALEVNHQVAHGVVGVRVWLVNFYGMLPRA